MSPPPPPPPRSRLQSERAAKRIRRATRLLLGCFAVGVVASFVFLVAMSSPGWLSVQLPEGVYQNSTHSYHVRHYGGLWRRCWVEWDNSSTTVVHRESCHMRTFFPTKEAPDTDAEIDYKIFDLSRSEAAFSVISLLLSAIPNFFTWYSIHEPRYMFKRLAGALHFITAGCIVVCIEVFKSTVDHEKRKASRGFPVGCVVQFGYSMYLAWTSFTLFVLVGITLFVLSAKRKGDKARSDREAFENEPVIIGRV